MRQLSLEGKITIFNSLVISKIVYLASLTLIPNSVFEELIELQKTLLWRNMRAKTKHDTLCNNFTEGGLKSVDIKQNFGIKVFLHTNAIQQKISRMYTNLSEIYSYSFW